jgi:type I restriction enzyme S subunit
MSAVHALPDGWRRISLQQIASIQTGVAKGKKAVKNRIELPYLRVANVQDGHLELSEIKTISVSRPEVARYSLQPGDVLMTEGGDFDKLGRGFVWEGQLSQCLHQNHVFVVRADSNHLDPYFLTYQAGSSYGKGYFLSCSKQSTNLASINSSQLKEFPVLLPPPREQRTIVQTIRTWDRAISFTEEMIAAKQERRAWLMQQLLTGKRRLPGFGNSATAGHPPEGWELPKTGKMFKGISRRNCGSEVVLSVTQDQGVVPRDSIDRKINMSFDNTDGYKLVEPGDFIISLRSFQGGIEYSRYRGLVSPAYHVIRPTTHICDDFYRFYFKSSVFIQRLAVAVIGIRDGKQVNFSDFSFMRIPLPPVKEQCAIASVLNVADREIDLIRLQVEEIRRQKKGLMQQLLTGKRRIIIPKAVTRS